MVSSAYRCIISEHQYVKHNANRMVPCDRRNCSIPDSKTAELAARPRIHDSEKGTKAWRREAWTESWVASTSACPVRKVTAWECDEVKGYTWAATLLAS